MKPFKTAALSAALMLVSLAAHAGAYQFSYSFDPMNTGDGNPLVVTGTFSGDQVGALISNISDVHVSLNGIAFNGPLLAEGWNASTQDFDSGVAAVVSTDVAQNSFAFLDTAMSNYVSFVGGSLFAVNTNSVDINNNALAGYETASTVKWSVSAVNAVPEPESYALALMGLGICGAAALRRKAR